MQNQEKSLVQALIDQIPNRSSRIDCSGLSGSERAYLAATLHSQLQQPMIVVVPTPKAAELFLEDLNFFSDKSNEQAHYFPPYNMLPFKHLSYHNETAASRIRTLYGLMVTETPPLVVTTIDALLQKIIPKTEISDYAELLIEGEDVDRDRLVEKLVWGGYGQTLIVEEPGEFCVRGGIVDVFSPLYPEPLRIEFFGETVDSLRFFSPETQRTVRRIQEAVILPAKEAILKQDNRNSFLRQIRQHAAMMDMPVTKTRNLIQRIKNEGMFPGIESLIPMMYPQLDTFFNYIPDHTLFVMIEPDQIHAEAEDHKERIEQNYLSACEDGRLCVEPSSIFLEWDTAKIMLEDRKPLTIKYFNIPVSDRSKGDSGLHLDFSIEDNTAVRSELKQQHHQMNIFSPVINWISKNRDQGNRIITVCRTKLQADRFMDLVKPYGVRTRIARGFHTDAPDHEILTVCLGRISTGFVWREESIAVITEDEIFGKKLRQKRSARKHVRTDLLSLDELKKGDLVVHLEHGIGQYQGLIKLDLDGVTNDYLLILYKGDDKLYLPIDRMNVIQKYIGVDGLTPVLDKMGGKAWDKVKKRVKRSAEKIAGELLNLYAGRKVRNGFGFGKPDSYFHDFEAAFPYEETEDQINAIDDVLSDMETPTPMDRLICGDVGYGKTEVALRASFITIYNGKQAALLVPTTVLAEQHLRTFTDRFKDYPVTIACLSRFRSPRVQREIINDLKAGKIDIVIGTHRIFQKDVTFKDLGLLIIDEEQRFGVRHKERIKQLRSRVDVLALTATPIPRTLHLSLLGIRDISVISTPPEHRRPILTYVTEFDDAVIAEAIRKELERKGQIFFVHNNIHTIYAMATHLQKLAPEVRLDVAHGRMKETELERVMVRFFQQEIDMLVCTTIIESGLDIPSANTILVNRADRFGLAQIYQLRGRVGRADEQAYAYLFIPRNSALGIDAQKRLRVLMEHSDLGSGFQIAMSDLKIRGGGTILGSDQSGHIAAVGYDMFLQLMEEAVTRMKGEPLAEPLEPEIHIPLSAFIPESYIPDIDQRLSTYRRLARMSDNKEISSLKVELADRFGPLPVETKNLLLKIMLRVLSKKCGVRRFDIAAGQLRLELSASHQINPNGVVELIQSDPNRYGLTPDHVLMAKLVGKRTNGQLKEAKNILKEIAQRVNA